MYTQETTDKLVALYNGGNGLAVEDLAKELGVSKHSVIAKLSKMGAYQKPDKKRAGRETKEDYILHVENLLGLHEGQLSALSAANLLVLRTLRNAIQEKAT
jgi:transposase